MGVALPETEHIRLDLDAGVLWLTLDRPERRNAMSFRMVDELMAALAAVSAHVDTVRAVVIRGAGGHFCAGGDIKDMAAARGEAPGPDGRDPIALANRRFGTVLEAVEAAPQPVLAVVEGAAMGGGFGLACVADMTLAVEGARFRLPETGLGITPAQVMPFIVRRVGLTQARRLAVTGETLDAAGAVALGLAHERCESEEATGERLAELLLQICRGAPRATAATKALALRAAAVPLGQALDEAAEGFARHSRSAEAVAGMMAFFSKETPPWAKPPAPAPDPDPEESP